MPAMGGILFHFAIILITIREIVWQGEGEPSPRLSHTIILITIRETVWQSRLSEKLLY